MLLDVLTARDDLQAGDICSLDVVLAHLSSLVSSHVYMRSSARAPNIHQYLPNVGT